MLISDWSSDVCSSDLLWRFLKVGPSEAVVEFHQPVTMEAFASRKGMAAWCHQRVLEGLSDINAGRATPGPRTPVPVSHATAAAAASSEERRAGTEWGGTGRSRG